MTPPSRQHFPMPTVTNDPLRLAQETSTKSTKTKKEKTAKSTGKGKKSKS